MALPGRYNEKCDGAGQSTGFYKIYSRGHFPKRVHCDTNKVQRNQRLARSTPKSLLPRDHRDAALSEAPQMVGA